MIRYLCFLVMITFAGLVYVFEEVQAVEIGYTIRRQEEIRVQFLDRARALKYNIECLNAPQNLERRLLAQRISLEAPKVWQTLVISDRPMGVRPAAARSSFHPQSFFGKFFVGTAQAEAKEPTNR